MAQRKTQPTGSSSFLHVRIEAEKIEQLRVVAEADHRTLSQEVRRMVDERLAADAKAAA